METLEEELDPAPKLQVITAVIKKSKENIKEHSFLFLLWGWLIAVASFSFFMIHAYTLQAVLSSFSCTGAYRYHYFGLYYTGRAQKPETYIDYYLKKLWLVLGISFVLVVVINLVKANLPFTYTLLICGSELWYQGLY